MIIVVLIITADFTVTLLVFLNVVITDIFLFGHVHYAGLTLNPLVVLNIIIAVGIAVDYSAHIAYAYLVEPVPDNSEYDTPTKIRIYKASKALRKMGSSVFHGGFSTFLAVLVLVANETYIGLVFFRLWFGIIFFGLANGFIFLPVMLSFVGPLHDLKDPLLEDKEEPKSPSNNSDSKVTPDPTSNYDTANGAASKTTPDSKPATV